MTTSIRELTKVQLVQVVTDFLANQFRNLVGEFLGEDRADLAFDLRGHPTRADLSVEYRENFALQSVCDSAFRYAQTGVWAGGDLWESMAIFEAFVRFPAQHPFHRIPEVDKNALEVVFETVRAREQFEPLSQYFLVDEEATLTRAQLAILSGLSEETVRGAKYKDGEDHLAMLDDGTIQRDEAKRWLIAKNCYQPSRFEYEHEYHPKHLISAGFSFRLWLKATLDQRGLSWDAVRRVVSKESQGDLEAFIAERLKSDGCRRLSWLQRDAAVLLGELLNVSPRWLLNCGVATRFEVDKAVADAIPEPGPSLPGSGDFEVPSALSISAQSIREVLAACPWISAHPKHLRKNAKMDGYLSKEGVAFAHEHELKRQYVWMPAEALSKRNALTHIDDYPAANVGKGGKYGRHSGLRKYPELEHAALVRVQISSARDLSEVLAILRGSVGQ